MVATAKKNKGLWVKQIDSRTFQVECQSKQHHYHTVVKSLSTGALVCDRACWSFSRNNRCPHTLEVAILLNGGRPLVARTAFELFSGDEITPEPAKPKVTLESLFENN